MAKHKIAPRQDDDEEETAEETPRREPAKPSRFRWLLSRLIVMLVLLGVLAWFAPTIASFPAVWKTGLGYAAPDLKNCVEIESLSLGWMSAVRGTNLVLKDPQGNVLAQVKDFSSDKSLYQLALDTTNLGKFRVGDPQATVVLRADGSNWEDFLKLLPKSETKESKPVGFQLELSRGIVNLDDQIAGRQWTVDGLNVAVDWPAAADKPRVGKISAAVKPGGMQPAAIAPGDLAAEFSWQPTATGLGGGQVKLQANSLALDISQGALVRAGIDVQAAGALTTELQYDFARDAQDHQLQIKQLTAPRLAVASATYLSTDNPQITIEGTQGQIQLAGGKLTVNGLDFRSNLLQISGNGQAIVSELSQAATGAIGADTQLQLQGQLDLAAVAAQLPATLHLKNDTRIVSGRVNLGLISRNEAAGRLWQGGLQTENLVAETGGQRVQWDEPLKLEGTARQNAVSIAIEELTGKSSFFDLKGSGTLAQGELTANADLNRLVAELDQFVDFGAMKLAGNLGAKLTWQQGQGDSWQATAEAAVQQFALEAPGVVPWREENLQLGAQVAGRINGTSLQQVTAAKFNVLSSADQLEATLTRAVDQPSSTTAWPLQFTLKGDLATWQPRLQAFVPLAGWRTAGGIDLQGAGSFSPQLAELQSSKLELSRLEVIGPGIAISEPKVVIESAASWDQENLTFISTSTTLASSAVALRGDNIKAVLGGSKPTVQGVVDYRGKIERLLTWFPSSGPKSVELKGDIGGRMEAALRDGKVEAVWNNDITDLEYATPDRPAAGNRSATLVTNPSTGLPPGFVLRRREKLVKISAQASYDPTTDALTISQAQLQSSVASLNADGSVSKLTKECVADVKGQYAYDWKVILQFVDDQLNPPNPNPNGPPPTPIVLPEIEGQETRQFTIRGPILNRAANSDDTAGRPVGLVHPDLIAQAEVAWQRASYFGVHAGPAVIPAKVERSVAYLGPLDLTIAEGKVVGTPRLNLAGASPLLEMDKGPVVQQMRISPEMCDGWMKFVAPLLAGVTRAEGKFSVDLEGARVPVDQPTLASVGGVMTIHTAEVGPGPLAQQYLNVAKQVKDIADGNYAGVAGLFTPGAAPDPNNNAATASRGLLVLPQQQVKFEMIDGRVHHQGLQMTVKDVVITTRGSVGLDQTMELVADVPIQDNWIKQNSALTSLKGQTIQIPIRGTLAKPLPDYRALTGLAANLGRSAVGGLLEKKIGGELNKFLPPGFNPAAPTPGAAPAQPGTTPAPPINPLEQFKGIFAPR